MLMSDAGMNVMLAVVADPLVAVASTVALSVVIYLILESVRDSRRERRLRRVRARSRQK